MRVIFIIIFFIAVLYAFQRIDCALGVEYACEKIDKAYEQLQ